MSGTLKRAFALLVLLAAVSIVSSLSFVSTQTPDDLPASPAERGAALLKAINLTLSDGQLGLTIDGKDDRAYSAKMDLNEAVRKLGDPNTYPLIILVAIVWLLSPVVVQAIKGHRPTPSAESFTAPEEKEQETDRTGPYRRIHGLTIGQISRIVECSADYIVSTSRPAAGSGRSGTGSRRYRAKHASGKKSG